MSTSGAESNGGGGGGKDLKRAVAFLTLDKVGEWVWVRLSLE